MTTLLLSRTQVERLLDPSALATQLRAGFIRYSNSSAGRALRVRAPIPDHRGTATVLFPGTLPDLGAYTVKVHAKFPDHDPAIRGVICLHDARTGTLLAIMDSTYITAIRTGIAGALAADVLARADASTVAVIGAGVQDRSSSARSQECARCAKSSCMTPTPIARPRSPRGWERSCLYRSNLLTISFLPSQEPTSSSRPLGRPPRSTCPVCCGRWHVTTLGADEPGKTELSADVISSSLFVCDDRQLAVEMGTLRGVELGADDRSRTGRGTRRHSSRPYPR